MIVLKMDSLLDLCLCFGGSAFAGFVFCSCTVFLFIVKAGTGFLVRTFWVETCTLLGSRTCFVARTLVSSEGGLRPVAEAVGASAL